MLWFYICNEYISSLHSDSRGIHQTILIRMIMRLITGTALQNLNFSSSKKWSFSYTYKVILVITSLVSYWMMLKYLKYLAYPYPRFHISNLTISKIFFIENLRIICDFQRSFRYLDRLCL